MDELLSPLFASFSRTQAVTRCWRKVDGAWIIREIAFTDDWSAAEYAAVLQELQTVLRAGGLVVGAFCEGALKGFAAVPPALFGSRGAHMDLSLLIVSQDLRGAGVGTVLFRIAQVFARRHGAKKLYISAHSAVETQAFYRAMGCVEALEYDPAHVEREPCDCQLECAL